MSEDVIVIKIYENGVAEIYKASRALKKHGYLGNDSINITPNKKDSTILISGSNLHDVEHAMGIYNKCLGKNHDGSIKYEVNTMKISERDRICAEVRREFQEEIIDLKETQTKLEEKWGKERTKYRDDISGMQEVIKREEKRATYLETDLKDTKIELIEEQIVGEEIGSALDKTASELDNLRKEHKNYTNRPFYRVISDHFKNKVASKK